MILLGFSEVPTAFPVTPRPSAGRGVPGRESKVLRFTPSSGACWLRDPGHEHVIRRGLSLLVCEMALLVQSCPPGVCCEPPMREH